MGISLVGNRPDSTDSGGRRREGRRPEGGRRRGGKRPNNIGLILEHFADRTTPVFHLDRPFDVAPEDGTRYSVGQLAALVARLSGGLHQMGLRKGDRLAIIKENHFDVVLLAAAAARIGALPAMISSTIKPENLRIMMNRLRPRVLVSDPEALAAAERIGVRLVEPDVAIIAAGRAAAPSGVSTFDDLRDAEVPPADPVADDEPMIATHTSGTTGVPKFVVHSAATTIGVNTKLETAPIPRLSIRRGDTVAACFAFMHIRAITWTVAQLVRPPAKVVVLADPTPKGVVDTLREHRPTTLEACPNLYQLWEGLTETHPWLFERVRTYFSTFDAIHPSTVRKFLAIPRRKPLWVQSWGQSEVGPVSIGVLTRRMVADDRQNADNNVGWPVPFVTHFKVVDPETRRPVKRGEEGLVLVRTRGRCLTYLGEHDRHQEKRWDGWWNTGDIGVRTKTGAIRILDREVDLIPGMSGIELESLLLQRIDKATEVIVLGVPDGRPQPVLSTVDGELDQEIWRAATADLPELAEPAVIPWEDFPRTATWKVRRFELREQILGSGQTIGSGKWT
ncbi:MAG TPA: class I adenylate-forming enzyme family protein [Streptosporangiaceae bacterium]|jgi:acyl-coenzyme A synthetase/AMP-(fatty) acid ligase|nr:class I adenylate-forming enzyme family protein [Streptosporangiaceae bacterium]